ncbi:MAG: DNA mismatch repair endonuclease MutL [Oscillospiraceae bacterium]|nr:DNA mismatch repair endonuclease MutL [Oscillospiraceae bacterium]
MPKIQQLSPHVADLIAAGEVVERPASAAKELVENAIDAGAKNITVELQNGGMTFLRVTDDGCGMSAEDAETAFLRHATSKLRTAADLEAIHTLGFRGEALAAISAVSHIDLMTKTADSAFGTGLHLDAGVVTERDSVGCPDGTTIIVRDLFYNTPARMKFMKRDTVEASALVSAVSRLAIAHPEVSVRVIRDGEEVLRTPGDGKLYSAVYAVLGRQNAQEMVEVNSRWESYALTGYVSKPSATRGNRANQLFFVNGRHVRSKTMTAALEEAYRNQLMVGRFPSCVLHLTLPEHLVDVNVHPAKVEVKFLNERDLFDCVRYGVEGALETASGRVQMKLPQQRQEERPAAPKPTVSASKVSSPDAFFRTMSAEDYKAFAQVVREAPRPQMTPELKAALERNKKTAAPVQKPETPQPAPIAKEDAAPAVQEELPLETQSYRIVGEVLNTYIIVEEGKNVLLIDKHAAHERILFEKLRSAETTVVPQLLLTPILCKPEWEEAAMLLENADLLRAAGFELSDYGDGVLAVRQIPADLAPEDAEATLNELAADLKAGKRADPTAMRDAILHTVACKAAIKGGWRSDEKEIAALVKEVLSRDDLKYCPHGRPITAVLTAAQLERQFKRA